MSDTDTELPALAPGTEALIEALLHRNGPQRPPRPASPDTSLLVRYLCNVLPAAEARQVEQSLTASPEARRAVRETRRVLDRLQALSWGETTAIGLGRSQEAETARAWMTLAAHSPEAETPVEAARQAVGVDSWTVLRHQAGGRRANALWTALLAFGAQWQAQLRRPLPATARGSADTLPMHGTRGGECRMRNARLDAEGTLRVEAVLEDPSGAPIFEFSGRSAYLALLVGGEALLCASSTLEGEQVSWTAPGVGDGIGQREVSFPVRGLVALIAPPERPALPVPSVIRFSRRLLAEGFVVASADPPAENEEVVGLLAANILTAEGRASPLPPAPWEIVEPPPRIENGRLTVAVRLPTITRSAYAQSHRLLLEIAVAPNEWQCLDAWPVEAWGEEARTLSISCPGRADGTLASITLLRARLSPLEAVNSDAA